MAAEKIGIIGTGRMGTAIATRLADRGFAVTVWNRTPDRTAAAVTAGAARAENLASLAERSEILISSLTDHAAIAGILDGEAGLLRAGVRGRLWIHA